MSSPSVDPEDLRYSPVAPFGVTVGDVADLCPDVGILEADPDQPRNTAGVTVRSVRGFIGDVSLLVTGALTDLHRITDKPRQEYLQAAAQAVVKNGAASYTEAAAHPDTVDVNSTSYAAVLWDRYTTGLTGLQAVLAGWVKDGGAGVTPQPGGASRATGYFPPPTFADRLRW